MSKLILIHLSDLHIEDSNSFSFERKKSIEEITAKKIEENKIADAILIFTGDISQSGKREQFGTASEYISDFIFKIKAFTNNYVGFYCCPGNHDIDFDIFNTINDSEEDKYLLAEGCFFDCAGKQKLFTDSKKHCRATFRTSDMKTKIDFFIINSTFGSLKDNPDKGLHYLSDDTILEMRDFRSDNRTILLMHHFEDYFDEDSSLAIREFIKQNCDFVFFGHTHKEENGTYVIGDRKIGISRGGALKDEQKSSVFCITLLDTDTNEYTTQVYEWNMQYRKYMFLHENNYEYDVKTNVSRDYYRKNNFQLLDMPKAKLEDIFVFPDMLFDQDREKKISTFDSFINLLDEEHNICVIKGFEKSGKTFLSKFIFNHYAKNAGNPILISKADEKRNFNETLQNVYKNQYDAGKIDCNRFLNSDFPSKVLIIDDAHLLSDRVINGVIQNRKCFEKILFICSEKKYITLFNKGLSSIDKDEILTFEIQPFIVSKRNELFIKTLKLFYPDIDDNKVQRYLKDMDKIISEQISIVTTNPEFLFLFAKSFGNRSYRSAGSNIFNEVFESNIILSLDKYNESAEKKIDVKVALGLLEALGYRAFKNSRSTFDESALFDIVQTRNNKSNLKKKISFSDYYSAFFASRIIIENDDKQLRFASNSFLSYFAARFIKKLYNTQNKSNEFVEELKYLSDNISIGLCGDILLFLCYQTGDMNIIEHLVQKATEFYHNVEELDFEKRNIDFLFNGNVRKKHVPSDGDKERQKEKQEQKEQKALTIREKKQFEKEAKNLIDVIFDGFRFVELVGKVLPDFIENIDEDDLILGCVDSLYKCSHKFLYQLLRLIEESIKDERKITDKMGAYDDVADDVSEFESKAAEESYQLIRIVYNSVARFASTEGTIKALDNFEKSSIAYTILNLYMHSYVEGDERYLTKYKSAKKMLDDRYSKRNFLHGLIEDTFFQYLVRSKYKYLGEMQRQIDLTFLLTSQGKQKSSAKFNAKMRKK